MGRRIHKVLGYGFRKVRFDKDPRLSPHALHTLDRAAHEERFGRGKDLRPQLVAFLEKKAPELTEGEQWEHRFEVESLRVKKGQNPGPLNYNDVVIYNPQDTAGKLPIGPLLFTVPYAKWSHNDDAIDYYEETQRTVRADGGVPDRCAIITDCEGQPCGIYPYDSCYVHRANGKLPRPLFTAARWSLTRALRSQGSKLKPGNEFGVKTLVDWQRHIVPEAPLFIRAFCECFEIFKAPKTIWRLRPMLYTYWC